jgi:LCP family protein required for cell wall assembly
MSDRPRREAPPAKRRASRPSLRNQLLMIFGILALAGGAFYTALVVVTQVDHIFFPDSEIHISGIPGVDQLPGVDAEGNSGEAATGDEGGRRQYILVMGLDRRPSDGEEPTRTDTMFLLMVDPVSDTARGLAMPRDLWVHIPIDDTPGNYIDDRINTAYRWGANNNWEGGGIGTVERTVENLLGIEIDHYVMIDFDGFREVVNLLGGIDIDVPDPGVDDPEYSETELPGDFYPCVFPPGHYHMDGSQALCYARVRRNSDDLDRINRQQRVMLAMIDKAAQLNFLDSPKALVNLWNKYKDTVKTDVNDLQVPGFAQMAANIDRNSLSFLTLGVVTTPFTTDDGAQVLLPSPEGVKQIVEAFLSDGQLLQENATVEVQNATATEGKATNTAAYLVSLGMPESNVVTSDAVPAPSPKTQIVVYGNSQYTAKRIAGWLGVSTEQIRTATPEDQTLRTTDSDILVILGDDVTVDYTPPPTPTPEP